ncbi:hypothetical protein [Amycolatopsis magusensis]|uniref:hypothetical protein n=1 Tax=Amycolatopsis magusensis TaxID=882444 RepID=UPI0037B30867
MAIAHGDRADLDHLAAAHSAPGVVPQPVPLPPYRAVQATPTPTPGDCAVYVETVRGAPVLSTRVDHAPDAGSCGRLALQVTATVLARDAPPPG